MTDARTLIGDLIAGSGWTDVDGRLGRVAGEVADEILRVHAHELAEKQREHVRRQAADPFHYGSAAWAIKGVDEVADLIDPEVTQ